MSRGKTESLFYGSEFDMLFDRWSRSKDDETLAQMVELSPPGGQAKLGKAIAQKLRAKRPDQKAAKDVEWREIDRLYRWLVVENGSTEDDAYQQIRLIYFADRGEERYDIKTIERQHRRWASKTRE